MRNLRLIPSLRAILFLAIGIVLAFAFQNCKGPSDSGSPPQKTIAPSMGGGGGTGNGYDGKIYAHVNASMRCVDGTLIDSVIIYKGAAPTLTKDNCRDLPENEQRVVVVEHDPNDSTRLTYAGRIYFEAMDDVQSVAVDEQGSRYLAGIRWSLKPSTDLHGEKTIRFLTKIQANGVTAWTRNLTITDAPKKSTLDLVRLAVAKNGDVIIGAEDYREGPPTSSREPMLIVVSGDGDILWSTKISIFNSTFFYLRGLSLDDDGSIYVSGYHLAPGDPSLPGDWLGLPVPKTNFYVSRLTRLGEPLWTRTFESMPTHDSNRRELYYSLNQSSAAGGGGVIFHGIHASEASIWKIASNGDLAWSYKFPGMRQTNPLFGTSYTHAQGLSDGGAVFTAPDAANTPSIIRLNANGQVVWARAFHAGLNSNIQFRGFRENTHGTIIAVGGKKNFQKQVQSIALAKLASDGTLQNALLINPLGNDTAWPMNDGVTVGVSSVWFMGMVKIGIGEFTTGFLSRFDSELRPLSTCRSCGSFDDFTQSFVAPQIRMEPGSAPSHSSPLTTTPFSGLTTTPGKHTIFEH